MHDPAAEAAILAIERPHRALWTYYLISALIVLPLFPIVILPLYFRYHTMRYKFTEEGISMSWGILFRRQIIVNYARVQDIHIRSNILERWLGLGRVLVQTATSSSAEMTLEGLREYEGVRDFLYGHMRGVRAHDAASGKREVHPAGSGQAVSEGGSDELAGALREAAGELRRLREALEAKAKR